MNSGVTIGKPARQVEKEKRNAKILADIKSIDNALENNDEKKLKSLHMKLDGIYGSYVPNWGLSTYNYIEKLGYNYESFDKNSLIHNLELYKAKLEGFMRDFPQNSQSVLPANNVSVSVNNTNEVSINITFEQAKQKIENMPGLTDEQAEEIKSKIDELENISKEKVSNKKKWEKVKPILGFILDKSADVAIMIMGLVLQMKLGL